MLPLYIASHITFEFQTHENSIVNSDLWARRIDVFVKCGSLDSDFDPLNLPEGFKMFNVIGQHNMIYDSYYYELNKEALTENT